MQGTVLYVYKCQHTYVCILIKLGCLENPPGDTLKLCDRIMCWQLGILNWLIIVLFRKQPIYVIL